MDKQNENNFILDLYFVSFVLALLFPYLLRKLDPSWAGVLSFYRMDGLICVGVV